ncbi:GAF domain-containing protein [Oscillatoria salina]|uniref:GAF domain-containing protein n=1 Tax=Oscillatoria salina TaxID=331517 RepID=UPI0013BAE9D7|nr:GAF domain-containing protein [Oscillatoria salina]MBZ8179501.1 GAF domain-containing protein [Oscillatoria salina IIICB1]NET88517.1 GAF domain-containing protein [Kamptonema sp. SIO1D9]
MGQQLPPTEENRLVALARVLQILREEDNASVLIETTLDYLSAEFDYRLIWIGLYDRLEHRLVGKGGKAPNGETSFLKKNFLLTPGDLLEQVVIQQRPVSVSDLREETRAGEWRRAALQFEVEGALLFPLRCKDRCFGLVLLGSHLWGVSPAPGERAELSLLFGSLATALYQIELEWQRSATKRPDQTFFQLFDELQQKLTLSKRLETIVNLTQQFIIPTRTNIYWYSPQRRYFWHRVTNQQMIRGVSDLRNSAPGITVAEAEDFYQMLVADRLVAIGSGRSPLRAESTGQLLSRLHARSLLAAPIIVQDELAGFLAVEDQEARIWEGAEKNYVRAVAQIAALVAGNEDLETRFEQSRSNTNLVAQVAEVLASNTDAKNALSTVGQLVCKRFEVPGFLVLNADRDDTYTLLYQYPSLNQRSLTIPIPILEDEEWQQMKPDGGLIAIENLEESEHFSNWSKALSQLGARSLLLHPIQNGDAKGMLLITHNAPRTWNSTERLLATVVAGQIGWLLKLVKLKNNTIALSSQQQTLQTGLTQLWEANSDRVWLEYLANLLTAPFALLLSWQKVSKPQGKITASVGALPSVDNLTIAVEGDPLLQAALASSNFYDCSLAGLNPISKKWLNYPQQAKAYLFPVRTYFHETAMGMFVFAFPDGSQFPTHLGEIATILMRQFAWYRRNQQQTATFLKGRRDNQTLNWYKHRCLEFLHQAVANWLALSETEPQGNKIEIGGQSLQQTRQQQKLRELEDIEATLTSVIAEEDWQLKGSLGVVSVPSLLKRSLRLVETSYQKRNLLTRIHNAGGLTVYSDRFKLECVLFELLLVAQSRAPEGSEIEFWCRTLPAHIEVLLVETWEVQPTNKSAAKLPWEIPADSFTPTNINLKVCQRIIQALGSKLRFHKLQDGRYLTRLILPTPRK